MDLTLPRTENIHTSTIHSSLVDELERALPEGTLFNINHTSTPPTKCAAIYPAPEGSKAQKTYCESHFLTASITPKDHEKQESPRSNVLIFAIEVLIYSTATLTTLFVSKADSTGYLHLLGLARGTTSPVQTISTTFISFLLRYRRRAGIPLVLALFARAQDQYLFPGSVENSGKHVLDDRGLVKWWCKVLDPVLRSWPGEHSGKGPDEQKANGVTSQGYLIIPGYDKYEIQSIFPVSHRADAQDQKRWHNEYPLEQISAYSNAPPRCLIPHFPDDPKARFLDELDEEISEASERHSSQRTGQWKSIKSMDQFWETMQFRQECSSGRLVGFIWVVLTPDKIVSYEAKDKKAGSFQTEDTNSNKFKPDLLPTPENSQSQDTIQRADTEIQKSLSQSQLSANLQSPVSAQAKSSHISRQKKPKKVKTKRLTGPIRTRPPRFRSNAISKSITSTSPHSPFYTWPCEGRGSTLLNEKDYKRINDLLLKLDFANLDVAQQSTRKWMDEIQHISGSESKIGSLVKGQFRTIAPTAESHGSANVLVARKRKSTVAEPHTTPSSIHDQTNTLSAGLVRKKPKP